MTYRSYRSGEAIMNEAYGTPQMDKSQVFDNDLTAEPKVWEDHYWKVAAKYGLHSPPKPIMHYRRPYFSGGLCPYGEKYLVEDHQWVFNWIKNKYILLPIKELFNPTDGQYEKYFKKLIERQKFGIYSRFCKARQCDIITVKPLKLIQK